MHAQSGALLSDEGVSALSDLWWMRCAAQWSWRLREHALHAQVGTGNDGTVQPRRVGIGLGFCCQKRRPSSVLSRPHNRPLRTRTTFTSREGLAEYNSRLEIAVN
jgi:hypothetical protein